MKLFGELFTALDQTTSTIRKIELLFRYFGQDIDERDKIWVVAVFTHRRPARTIPARLLSIWAAEIADIPLWLFEENYHVVGDLAETIALVLPLASQHSNMSLAYWIEYIKELKGLSEEEKKEKIVSAWSQLDPIERMLFNKLITGGFRVGVSDKLIVKALAKYTLQDENVIMHKLMGNWSPDSTTWRQLLYEEDSSAALYRPYPFYLSYSIDNSREEDPVRILKAGGISGEKWIAEWKWDGIRGQLIKRAGVVSLWSRGEELITEKFPEFAGVRQIESVDFVLDGEITAYKDYPLDFAVLQTRLGRKKLTRKNLLEAPVKFIAYDLLEYHGEDVRERPYLMRRLMLERLICFFPENVNIILSEMHSFKTLEEVIQLREAARNNFAEGIMLKSKVGKYLSGRKRGEIWKWKLDPYIIDAVMIYAQRGHGRRANLYSDFTFAVWDGEVLVPFAKAYSGLTDKEMREITGFVRRNTIEKFGPVSAVKAELVFEIAFEGIAVSARHKSGVALRFPRIRRWRKDKLPHDAGKIEDLKAFIS